MPPKRRPTSREETKQQTREALLRAALRLIPARGLDVSLDEICDEAGYTRGAFYVHFPDRDALLAAVMERVGKSVLDALVGATGEDLDLGNVAGRFLLGLSTGAYPLTRAGGVRPYQLLDACARSPEVKKQYLSLVTDAVARLAATLGAGQAAGRVRDDVRPDDLGMILVAIAIGVHTLVDLDVKLDLGRASGSLLGLLAASPDPVRKRAARAPRGRRMPRT